MSDTKVTFIPALALEYEDNLLESVSVGGETYRREQEDWKAVADRLRSAIDDTKENARLIEGENEKLRELVRIAGTYCVNGLCGKDDGCPLYLGKPYCALSDRMRELGIDVGE